MGFGSRRGVRQPKAQAPAELLGAGERVDGPYSQFVKRHVGTHAHSPVIPFYWGYRASADERTRRNNGQWLDEAGNRLP